MSNDTYVKQVYNELLRMHECGFYTWCSQTWELVRDYGIELDSDQSKFKLKAKHIIQNKFKQHWLNEIKNNDRNPITRTYKLFKHSFGMEPYLHKVSNPKYRQALTRLRTSSHALRIETGRHEKETASIESRKCHNCNVLEDELHFLVMCPLYETERKNLFDSIGFLDDVISQYSPIDQFICILNMTSQRHLEQIARFIHICLEKHRNLINVV